MENLEAIITKSFQLAIQVHKDGKSVDEALRQAKIKFYIEYRSNESRKASERSIRGYFERTPVYVPVIGTKPVQSVITPPEHPFRSRVLEVVGNPGNFTKLAIIALGIEMGITLPKSKTKQQMIEILHKATELKAKAA